MCVFLHLQWLMLGHLFLGGGLGKQRGTRQKRVIMDIWWIFVLKLVSKHFCQPKGNFWWKMMTFLSLLLSKRVDNYLGNLWCAKIRKKTFWTELPAIYMTIAFNTLILISKVFKVKSKEDGCLYAVKKSRDKFRGDADRWG